MAVKMETLIARAKVEFGLDVANPELTAPYSPARATKAIAKRYSYPASRLIPMMAEVYYDGNGRAMPFAKSAAKGRKALANAVAKRRNADDRMARWDVLAYSASETLGRPVSVAAVRALCEEAGVDLDASYTGQGTRKGAQKTRASETAELEGSLQ